ncbi:hypothetical protein F7731_10530 [Cytobacillus depressus]|uniref:Uncharacterized protein n=1 Tax=Cytobacillus depressus TaxID=1602942 RepID=A0A6L3V698_9BACI|nr:hypothetical protein [Cytobacillus depressus]KAB2336779.1 hypothetical protein F7731_10530 [Cytobacillus depressus]
MKTGFLLNSSSGEFKINKISDYKINFLKHELRTYKSIKVPYIDYSISGDELADWLLEISSPQEVEEIILMIKYARKRGAAGKSILQTIAAALVK